MVPRQSYPPIYHHPHLTTTLTPSAAQKQLAVFLAKTESKPFLHPDAQLSTAGVDYAAQSGLSGGLAIHHLRRIEAGLRGENLVAETKEELASFDEVTALPPSDDTRVDAVINSGVMKGGLKRKRSTEDVSRWAEESSEAAFDAQAQAGAEDVDGWQEQEEYEHEQRPLVDEIGERGSGAVMKQNGAPPKIRHVPDAEPNSKQQQGKVDKAARKAAKKARKKEEKRAKVKEESDAEAG